MKNNRFELYNREQEKRTKKIRYLDKDAQEIIDTFRNNINRIKKQFKIVDGLQQQNKSEEANDILRFQIVYAMSALDFFMHELYVFSFLKIFKNEMPKTERYLEYKVPLKLIEKALYDAENIDTYLKDAFIELNSNYTFMSSSRIKELLNMIAGNDEFNEAERRLKNKRVIRQHIRLDNLIDHIYERRNKIAHQTDINHGEDDKNIITMDDVEYYIDVIDNFVEEIYKTIYIK